MAEDGNSQGDTGAEGGEATSFLDGIQSEDLRGQLGDFKETGVDGLAQAFVDLKGSQPQVPEKLDDYTFDLDESVDDEYRESVDGFKQTALEAKMSSDQFQAVMGHLSKEAKAAEDTMEEARQTALKELEADAKYGGEFLKPNLAKAQKLLAKYGSEDLLHEDLSKAIADGNTGEILANRTSFFRFLVNVANDFSEDHFNLGEGDTGGETREVDDAGKPVIKFKDMG